MQAKIRSLASDTLVYGVSTILQRFLSFLLTPLYTNYLTKGEIGDVSAIYAMIAFVNIAYSLGMEPAFMRFFDRNDAVRTATIYGVAYRSVGVLALIVTGLTMLFAGPVAGSPFLRLDGDGTSLILVAAMVPLFDALVLIPFARLRMEQRPRRFAMLRLFSVVVNVALNVLFIVIMGLRVEGVLWSGVLSSVATFMFFVPDVVKALKVRFDRAVFREMIGFGLPTVPASFSSIMVLVADRPLLLMMLGNAAVGMYQTNFRLALPMMLFVTVFEYAWKPFYLTHREDPDAKTTFARILTLFTAVCGIIFLLTVSFIPYVVQLPFVGGRFINPQYWSGLVIVPVVMFAYYFNGMFINMAAGLHIEKRTGYFPLATGVAAALNVVATLVLLPSMGFMGAAWAKVIAYIGSVVVLYWALQRIYPIRYDWLRIAYCIGACAAVYSTVLFTSDQTTTGLVARIAAVPVYVLLLVVGGIVAPSSWRMLASLVRR